MTLSEFVRSEGGIYYEPRYSGHRRDAKGRRRRRILEGDVSTLDSSNAGTRGLTTRTKGKGLSPDAMYQAATQAGFPLTSPDDLVQRLDMETRGRKTYATRGFVDYRDNPQIVNGKWNAMIAGQMWLLIDADGRTIGQVRKEREAHTDISTGKRSKVAYRAWDRSGSSPLFASLAVAKKWVTRKPVKLNPPKSHLYVVQLGSRSWGLYLRTYLLGKFATKAAAEIKMRSIQARAKQNPAAKTMRLDMISQKKNPADGKAIAQEIVRQLGGGRFIAMTGAKNFTVTAGGNGVVFRIPKAKSGINYVKITLNGLDLYDLEFIAARGTALKTVATEKDFYNDMLQAAFTKHTGLATSLGTMGRTNPAVHRKGLTDAVRLAIAAGNKAAEKKGYHLYLDRGFGAGDVAMYDSRSDVLINVYSIGSQSLTAFRKWIAEQVELQGQRLKSNPKSPSASHKPAVCVRDVRGSQYVGKGYKSKFECPTCGRYTWQLLNMLGRRDVICNGEKFSKVAKNPKSPSASRLAKDAIAVFDADLDLDLDVADVVKLQKGERILKRRKGRRKNPPYAYALWGTPKVGGSEELVWESQNLNKPITAEQRAKLKSIADSQGFTKLRIQEIDLGQPLDFLGTAGVRRKRNYGGLFCFECGEDISYHGHMAGQCLNCGSSDYGDEREYKAYQQQLRSRPKTNPSKRNPVGWFRDVSPVTADAVKKLYRKLAAKYHPDKGGDTRTMQEINADYEKAIKIAASNEGNEFRADRERQAARPLREAIEFAVTLPDDIKVVIRGLWLWLEGNTWASRERIKSFASSNGTRFKYASKKKAWFFAGVPSSNRGREYSLEDIDLMHGKQIVEERRRRLSLQGNPADVAYVQLLPKCDIHGTHHAAFDAKITIGGRSVWAYVCAGAFAKYGGQLGVGKGQRLEVIKDKIEREPREYAGNPPPPVKAIQKALAAGRRAADASMKKAGRKKWNAIDLAKAKAAFKKMCGEAFDTVVKNNPIHPIAAFAAGASGILSALQIKEMMNRPRRKTRTRRKANGKTTAKAGTAAKKKNPYGTYKAGDRMYQVWITPRNSQSIARHGMVVWGANKERAIAEAKAQHRQMAGARNRDYTYSAIRLNPPNKAQGQRKNPPARKRKNPPAGVTPMHVYLLTIYDADGKAKAVYMVRLRDHKRLERKFRTAAAAKRFATTNGLKLVENPTANPTGRIVAVLNRWTLVRDRSFNGAKQFVIVSPQGVEVARERTAVLGRKKLEVLAAKANPAKVPHRRTFSMFQGRPATTAKALPVSRHAPARLDQLGDLIEIKLADGQVIQPNPKRFKLCASGGRLWIAGGTFAKANPKSKANGLDKIGEIDHVVYGTHKPHHGDHRYTHYIHRLGEESGHRPTLAVDREGFPIIRGGRYTIESRGIVN